MLTYLVLTVFLGASATIGYPGGVSVGVTDGADPGSWYPGLVYPLRVASCPELDSVIDFGCSVEYTLRGVAADEQPDSTAMRWWGLRYPSLELPDASTAVLHWPASISPVDVDGTLRFECGRDYIDFTFSWTPGDGFTAPHGYADHMFANYARGGRSRCLYFYGVDAEGVEGWYAFGGGDSEPWFFGGALECGTVSYVNPVVPLVGGADVPVSIETMPSLPHDDAQMVTMNLVDSIAGYRFLWPFYYCVLDADGDMGTTEDNLLYVVMFKPEDARNVRFALWDWSGDDNEGRCAWDWHWVTASPELGRTYTYTMRMMLIPMPLSVGDPGKSRVERSHEVAMESRLVVMQAYADYAGIDYAQPMPGPGMIWWISLILLFFVALYFTREFIRDWFRDSMVDRFIGAWWK